MNQFMTDRYSIRRDKIRRQVVKQRLDAVLISNPINVRYLTGFTGGDSFLLMKRSGDILISDGRFTIQIKEECSGLDVYIRSNACTLHKATAKQLGKTGKLGLEADSLTLTGKEQIATEIPAWELVPTQKLVEELRQVKDRAEIDAIRKAIDIACSAFLDIRDNIDAKQSEMEISNDLEYRMRLFEAEEKSFPSIVCAGQRAALPHGSPSSLKLEEQSHLLIDWGAVSGGYKSDLTRVLIFSPKDKKLRSIYETVRNAQETAINAVKPGKTCGEIDAVARAIIKDAGFGRNFNHGLGHAIGLEIHESPRFTVDNNTVLKPGMVMTVEPGIYLKGWGGVRIEDDILITKTGCEVLSRSLPKSFEEIVNIL
jgi:Xaa-Pro aminopeptidase